MTEVSKTLEEAVHVWRTRAELWRIHEQTWSHIRDKTSIMNTDIKLNHPHSRCRPQSSPNLSNLLHPSYSATFLSEWNSVSSQPPCFTTHLPFFCFSTFANMSLHFPSFTFYPQGSLKTLQTTFKAFLNQSCHDVKNHRPGFGKC